MLKIKTQTANSTASKPKGNYKKRATDRLAMLLPSTN